MPGLTIECDVFPPVTHNLGHCFIKIELSAMLVKISKLDVNAPLD